MSTPLTATPAQTIGPFFGYALPFDRCNELVPLGSPGAIQLHGIVADGDGSGVPDALLEIWQADADGTVPDAAGSLHRDGWTFTGWGRAGTDDAGRYSFSTIIPGAVDPGAAPFILITVFARGLLNRLFTRAYIPDELLSQDPLVTSLAPERSDTLIAVHDDTGLRFDIQLQDTPGKPETVFLRYPGHQR
ncbi:protocatechuate 3,4-dioxygenase subunit alpha [[Mycobacterium] burgundiense]|uniref:Protocatechuate 3,4-dioxygenase subunit alpha n=1 Tax=[Mycobacterium] burgundiense TaxID=3064286 RepID=A0ABN9NWD0_9MYCO|nr:protocatechuate 3,4-dioxygenase subunit alpha [Mycolicibacterium sp. MU0053]CAJ1511172.1 protocatechuate 3,4-dioxygenase subunit alpha [Mycolicibacterium sp. MU0053]